MEASWLVEDGPDIYLGDNGVEAVMISTNDVVRAEFMGKKAVGNGQKSI